MGGSQGNIVDPSFIQGRNLQDKISACKYHLKAFNGSIIEPLGEIKLAIEIANITYEDWFTVSPTDPRYDMILGMRFLNDPAIDVGRKTQNSLVRLAGDETRITTEGF